MAALKTLLIVAGSIVVAIGVILLVQLINLQLAPLPPGLDPSNPDDLAKIMEDIPLSALLVVELAYLLGSLAGGVTLGKLGSKHDWRLVLCVGGFLTVVGAFNLVTIPHPIWFAIVSTLTYLPAVYVGSWLAGKSEGASA